MEIAEFLLARIVEDEAVALEASWRFAEHSAPESVGDHIARHDPARVLADCEAKRRILELHRQYEWPGCDGDGAHGRENCLTLRILARPYADHPDFRPEWSALADA